MSYPPSAFKTWTSGEILTASDLNNTVTAINNSNITEDIDDYSTNASEMQSTVDPYPSSTESLPTSLSGELERLRYLIAQITGKTYWYQDPSPTLSDTVNKTGAQTIAGDKTFTGAIITPNATSTSPSITHTSDTDTGFGFADNTIYATTSGALAHQIDSSGRNTYPLQPCFMARVGSEISNVTGNGVSYDIVFDTEDFDVGSNFNSGTGVFTAPVTGKYFFSAVIDYNGMVGATNAQARLVTTARTYFGVMHGATLGAGVNTSVSAIVSMTAGDTAKIQANSSGESGTTTDIGTHSYFSGMLVA